MASSSTPSLPAVRDVSTEMQSHMDTIRTALEHAQHFSDTIEKAVASLDQQLQSAEAAIRPVYTAVQPYLRAQNVLDDALKEFDQAVAHFALADTEPPKYIESDYHSYLRWLNSVHRAVEFFGPHGNGYRVKHGRRTLEKLRDMQRLAHQICLAEFSKILQAAIRFDLRYMGMDEADKLKNIAHTMEMGGSNQFLALMIEQLAAMMKSNLKRIAGEKKPAKNSEQSASDSRILISSPSFSAVASDSMSAQSTVTNAVISTGKTAQLIASFIEQSVSVESILSRVLGMSASSNAVYCRIINFTVANKRSVFQTLLNTVLNTLLDDKKQPAARLLSSLESLQVLNTYMPELRKLLREDEQFSKVIDMQNAFQNASVKALMEYRNFVIGSCTAQTKTKHDDGTVHAATIQCLNFIKKFCIFKTVVEGLPSDKLNAIDARIAGFNWNELMSSSASNSEKVNIPLLWRLIAWILAALESSLNNRASKLNPPSLSAIFLLNNFHAIVRFAQRGDLEDHDVGCSLATVIGNAYAQRQLDAMNHYRKVSWESLLNAIDMTEPNIHKLVLQLQNTRALHHVSDKQLIPLTDKNQRKTVKGKFTLFNNEFETQFKSQKVFDVPDEDLRSELRKGNADLLLKPYEDLYIAFVDVDFSNTPAKYIKYTPQTLKQLLMKFFTGLNE